MKIPLPSPEQIQRFKEHVVSVHSWYKHLPLMEGGLFVVYLEEDLDREYPTQHPKLPFGNTKEGYEQAFGNLCYMYFIRNYWYLPYNTKIVEGKRVEITKPEFSDEYMKLCSFTLYPFCHRGFEEIYNLHKDTLDAIAAGAYHPESDLLLKWRKEYLSIEEANYRYFGLLESKLLWAEEIKGMKIEEEDIPERLRPYWASKRRRYDYLTELRKREEKKVEDAIHNLILFHSS